MAASPQPSALEQQPHLGLRERKKLKTRIAIRRATYRLIDEQGYEATTIEQIAEAAEVSASTVFRYFPTKEDIVLTDEYDPLMAEVLRGRPADEPPLESIRFIVMHQLGGVFANEDELAEMRQRTRLMVEIPAVRARMSESMSVTSKLLTGVLAERTGREENDLQLRIFTAAVMGALREVTLYWGEHGNKDDLFALIDGALNSLAGGLRL
ncbi:TetR/AcrR family transcriptional regulator [Streptomyces sp. NBC_00370]|uniref:TetR/AcrR family transcriptional regulator n=1 Tax=Streptomyces sp. NBC_00370 TaxID=2975728 RepID=UPI002E262EEE